MYGRRIDGKILWRYSLNAKCKVDELRNTYMNYVDNCGLIMKALEDFFK